MTGKTHKNVALITTVAAAATTMAITLEPLTVMHARVPALIPFLWIPLSMAGGLSPDLDEPQAKASRWFRRVYRFTTPILVVLFLVALFRNMHSIVLIGAFLTLVLTTAVRFLAVYTQHRRETHSLFFLVILITISYTLAWTLSTVHPWLTLIAWNLGIGFTIGAFSHLLIDSFNIKPGHWLYPIEYLLRDKKTGRLRFFIPTLFKIRTGGQEEQIFNKVYPVVVVIICLAIIGVYYLL